MSGLRARQVTKQDFAEFDLIIAMDEANLKELQVQRPKHARAEVRLFLNGQAVPDPYCGEEAGFERVLDLAFLGSHELIRELQQRS